MNRHADEEQLERYSMGVLPEGDEAVVEEHLLICSTCQRKLEEMDAYTRAMRQAASEVRSAERASRPLRARTARFSRPVWAAAFAVLALAFVVATAGRWTRTTTPATILLTATRGAEGLPNTAVPAQTPLIVKIDLTELESQPEYTVQIVDPNGRQILRSVETPRQGNLTIPVRGLGPGNYFVRLSSATELLREYEIRVNPGR